MSIGLYYNGGVIGAEPGHPTIYANRTQVGPWEQATITRNIQWSDIKLNAINMQVCVNQQTEQLELRPAGAIGGWGGQWNISDDGKTATCSTVTLQIEGYQVVKPIHLEVRGRDFVDAKGTRIHLIGCDGFLDYRIWLDRGQAGLDPFLKESNEIGFQVRRVLLQGDISQNTVFTLWPSHEPNWLPQLRPFVFYCNSKGIVPLLTFCVDNQVVGSNLLQLWNQAHETLKGTQYLASWGNELDKNGGDPAVCPTPPAGVIWSRGSRTQDKFYPSNGASAVEFHPVRGIERCMMDTVASAVFIENMTPGMLWMDEGIPFDNDSNPHDAYVLSRLWSTLWALQIVHNRQGQRGQLMGPGTRACAVAAVRGAQL